MIFKKRNLHNYKPIILKIGAPKNWGLKPWFQWLHAKASLGNWSRQQHGDMFVSVKEFGKTACSHFEKIFIGEDKVINEEILNSIPSMITDQQNQLLQAMPTKEELKKVVFSMSATSATGPDGMNGKFFHSC